MFETIEPFAARTAGPDPVRFAVLGTYPPTQCGLASFANSLLEALRSPRDDVRVLGIVDEPSADRHPDVAHEWVRNADGAVAAAADHLNGYDIAIIQHEYGIYPGRDGVVLLDLLPLLTVPTVTVLHTVLVTPSESQRSILEALVAHSVAVVTMTHTAKERLIAHYDIDPTKVRVIPHGAADNRPSLREVRSADTAPLTGEHADRAPVVLTWGLLGEGKGIEWAIEAMAGLRDLSPQPQYHVVGQTHPKVVERFGERYRESLVARAVELGVEDAVHFDARYIDKTELNALVQQADIVLLPYDSREQVTSGVLIEAVTAGKPVVSTGFPHARELLASGAGLLVERQDPEGMTAALRRVLTEPGLAAAMAAEATRVAPELLWPAVADGYRRLAAEALGTADLRESA
ncbi:glycosyltransferase [Nakamurella deserti]|uniref:glycosyltransferase n=1 Tax=Nakamurella deserti TaxID=2164074 RepID=UPI001F0BBF70|nr:glycosyltransferase [Nakamurella deserti]